MNCPKCQAPLEASGQIDADGEAYSVYQCDRCTHEWEFDGKKFPVALTFAIDSRGRFFDPESLRPLDLN